MRATKDLLTVLLSVVMLTACAYAQKNPKTPPPTPTLITLDVKNLLWRDAFLALNEASGDQLEVPKADSPYSLPISMELRDVPFLKALNEIQKIAPFSYSTSRSKRVLQINWNHNDENLNYIVYPGPARIMLQSCSVERSASFNSESDQGIIPKETIASQLNMSVTLEPKLDIDAIAVELTEMTDDTGRNLLESPNENRRYGQYRQEWQRSNGTFNNKIQLLAGIPAREATTLKNIKGKLLLDIKPDLPPTRLEPGKENQQIEMADGTYTLTSIETNDNHEWKALFTPPLDYDRRSAYQRFRETRLTNAKNENTIQNPNVTFRHPVANRVELELRFNLPEDFEPAAILFPNITPSETFEYDFEFANIPLPPLESIYYEGAAKSTTPSPATDVATTTSEHLFPLENLKDSSFSVNVGQQPILSVVDRIAAETGNPIEMPSYRLLSPNSEERPSPPITVKVEEAPFWKALEDFCNQTHCQAHFNYKRDLALHTDMHSRDVPSTWIRDVGPIRFCITNICIRAKSNVSLIYHALRSVDNDIALEVNGQIWVEPRIPIICQGSSVETCRADDGSDLLEAPNRSSTSFAQLTLDDSRLTRSPNIFGNIQGYFTTRISLNGRNIPQSLDEMTLYYFLSTTDKKQTIEITEPKKIAVYDIEGGGTVRWAGLQQENNRSVIRFGVDLPGTIMNNDLRYSDEFEAFDAEGKQISNLNLNMTRLRSGLAFITCNFNKNQKPAKVILKVPSGIKTYAGTVTFKDIKLPEFSPELPE